MQNDPLDNLTNESCPYAPGMFIRFTRWLSSDFLHWLDANTLTKDSVAVITHVANDYITYRFPSAAHSPHVKWIVNNNEADKAFEPWYGA